MCVGEQVVLLALDFSCAQIFQSIAVAVGFATRSREQKSEAERQAQKASTGSAMMLSAPASILRRSAPAWGRMRSA